MQTPAEENNHQNRCRQHLRDGSSVVRPVSKTGFLMPALRAVDCRQ
jgi:hypothetical protein